MWPRRASQKLPRTRVFHLVGYCGYCQRRSDKLRKKAFLCCQRAHYTLLLHLCYTQAAIDNDYAGNYDNADFDGNYDDADFDGNYHIIIISHLRLEASAGQ